MLFVGVESQFEKRFRNEGLPTVFDSKLSVTASATSSGASSSLVWVSSFDAPGSFDGAIVAGADSAVGLTSELPAEFKSIEKFSDPSDWPSNVTGMLMVNGDIVLPSVDV